MGQSLLVVDLNNFARYPSIAVGYLVSVLRQGGFDVEVLAPLATGVTGVPREVPPPWWGVLDQEIRYRTAVSKNRLIKALRSRIASMTASSLARSKGEIVAQVGRYLERHFDAVLVSAYLMYYPHCAAIGALCKSRDVPLILGGPYFAAEDVAEEWIDMPGLSALVGGEIEHRLCELVTRVIHRQPISSFDGVWRKNGSISLVAPPLVDLDSLPFPDYSGFPWDRYPNTIIPVITGRGCGWGVCLFCSDVSSTAGRTFRSRSPQNVLSELKYHHLQSGCQLFVFTDLKLNSNLAMWRSLISGIQQAAPGARWIGSVHVGTHGDNGLSLSELTAARKAGLVRLTTGVESGSRHILDKMAKGTDPGITSRFLEDAGRAGISIRATMIIGYPGENAADIDCTKQFLEEHERFLQRIRLNRLQIQSGTQLAKLVARKPDKFPDIVVEATDHQQAHIEHHMKATDDPDYRHAVSRLLRVVHRINRKPLPPDARDFEGVM